MRVKVGGWIFVLLLTIAPVLVAAITITQTDIPTTNPLLGNLAPPINPWIDDLPVSIIPAVLSGIVGWLIAFIPTRIGFKTSRTLIKIATMGILVSLALVVLWLGIVSAHLWIVLKYWYTPMIGFPIPDLWVLVLGAGWTGGIVLFTLLCSGRQLVER
jgi:hypothetical protein